MGIALFGALSRFTGYFVFSSGGASGKGVSFAVTGSVFVPPAVSAVAREGAFSSDFARVAPSGGALEADCSNRFCRRLSSREEISVTSPPRMM